MIRRRNILLALGTIGATGLGVWGRRQWFDRHYAQPTFNSSEATSYATQSPNGHLRAALLFDVVGGASPRWRVQYRNRDVLEPSALGLILADGRKLGPGVRIIGQQLTPVNEGGEAPYADACNELTVQMLDAATGIIFDVVLRAYDLGAALRYLIRHIPGTDPLEPFTTPWRLVPIAP